MKLGLKIIYRTYILDIVFRQLTLLMTYPIVLEGHNKHKTSWHVYQVEHNGQNSNQICEITLLYPCTAKCRATNPRVMYLSLLTYSKLNHNGSSSTVCLCIGNMNKSANTLL